MAAGWRPWLLVAAVQSRRACPCGRQHCSRVLTMCQLSSQRASDPDRLCHGFMIQAHSGFLNMRLIPGISSMESGGGDAGCGFQEVGEVSWWRLPFTLSLSFLWERREVADHLYGLHSQTTSLSVPISLLQVCCPLPSTKNSYHCQPLDP